MKQQSLHQKKIHSLQQQLKQAHKKKCPIFLQRKGASNSTRNPKDKPGLSLDVSTLNQILEMDEEKKEVWVEPGVTVEALVKATYKKGLVPKVVPEFKGITVGGAIQGGALESSSFREGQFNDTCLSYEVLLGNGQLVWASPYQHPELFYGLSSSYGTFALLCSVKISLEPQAKQVHLEFFRFNTFHRLNRALKTLLPLAHYDFLEGIGYHSNLWVLIAGNTVKERGRHTLKLSKRSPWYYEQVYKLALQKVDEAEMDLKSYLFRHDQGAFWMARYLNNPATLLLYLLQRKPGETRFHQLIERLKKEPLKLSHSLLRNLLGFKLSSQSLYKVLHQMPKDWVRQFLMIQDCYLPLSSVEEFVDFAQKKLNLFPLWFCPIKSAEPSQLFAPHSSSKEHFFINVGLYGIPKRPENAGELTLEVEEKVHQLGGRKMLYGHNFYTPEHFWKHYPYAGYKALRERYDAQFALRPITEKILQA